jgi:DNA-binding winged helix-turn-helix (wHTH) protein/tetratricopeptide (TPR) repeat protein
VHAGNVARSRADVARELIEFLKKTYRARIVNTVRHFYEFTPFRLDPVERRLVREGTPVALTPKCFDLLVVLVESAGHLLEKSELLARVWPDQFVEESSLSFNISELRRALGEGADGRQFIETVRKKGFRFVAPVRESADDTAPPPAVPRRWAIPVLAGVIVLAVVFGTWVIVRKSEQAPVKRHATVNREAHELYLKGRYFQDKKTGESLQRSIDLFREATVKDPRDALAFAALSQSYSVLAIRADSPPKVAYEKARAAALRAIHIDETLPDGHTALGNVKSWYDWDWPGAGREFQRAIELGGNDRVPGYEYASHLLAVGRREEAVAEIRRAQRLAPLSLTIKVHTARILYFAGLYDASMEQCLKVIDMDPGFGGAYLFVGRIDTERGAYDDALSALDKARALLHDSAEVLSLIGYTDAVSGRTAQAHQMLEQLTRLSKQRYVSPYHLAMIHTALGDHDAAFAALEQAYAEREGRLTIVRFAPEFQSLRDDPRFRSLMQRMKFV